MSSLEWYDYLRMISSFMALWSVYLIGRRLNRNWTTYTRTLREQCWVIQALLLLLTEASLENVVRNQDWGAKTLLGFLISAAALRAQLKHQGYLKGESPLK